MADNATGLDYLSQKVVSFQAGLTGLQEALSLSQDQPPELNGRLARYLRAVLPEASQTMAAQLPCLLTHKFSESLGVALFAPGGRPLLVNEAFSTFFPFPWRMLTKEIPGELKLYLCENGQPGAGLLEFWPWHGEEKLARFMRLARKEEASCRYFDLALYQVGQGAQLPDTAATFGFILESTEEVLLEMRMADSRLRLSGLLGEFDEPARRLFGLLERARCLPGLSCAALSESAAVSPEALPEAGEAQEFVTLAESELAAPQTLVPALGQSFLEEERVESAPEALCGEPEAETGSELDLELDLALETASGSEEAFEHESCDVMLESIQEIIEDSILQSFHEPIAEATGEETFNAAPVALEEAVTEPSCLSPVEEEVEGAEVDPLSCAVVADFEEAHWQDASELEPQAQEVRLEQAAAEGENSGEDNFVVEDLEQSTQTDITALWQEYSDFEPPATHLEEEMMEPVAEAEMEATPAEALEAVSAVSPAQALGALPGEKEVNLRCLVVDDIPVNQKLVVLQLKRLGFKPDLASNGLEAMKLIEQNNYAMIFMDLDMPYMNGFEATREIRKREILSNSHLPVIGMVSYDREGERRSCLDGGMDDCMVKGVEASNLKGLIDSVLARCTQPQELAATQESTDSIPLEALAVEEPPSEEKQCREVRQFIESMNDVVNRMQKLVDSRDTQQIEQSGARVTGALQVLNLSHIEIVLDEIIRLAQKGDWPQVRLKYLKLKTLYMRSQAELKKQHPSAFNEMASH